MKNTRTILHFLDLAFQDYLASRTLLRGQFLLQGSQLAATSIEKMLKAIIAVRGNECRGHLSAALLRSIEHYQPTLWSGLDHSFIALLQRCYDLRYLDDGKPDDGVVLHQSAILEQLDRTFANIDRGFQTTSHLTPYRQALTARDLALYADNVCFVESANRGENSLSAVHQYLIDENHNLVVLKYTTVDSGLQQPFTHQPGVRDESGAVRMRIAYTPSSA